MWATKFCKKAAVVKERARKAYRVPELDDVLTKRRLVQEARCISKARRAGIAAPCIYAVDIKKSRIVMERVEGSTMKQVIPTLDKAAGEALGKLIGDVIARLHDADIVHGDLTTSNMIYRGGESPKVTLIDFGLAMSRVSAEEKAVDLYVLERAFASSHPGTEYIFDKVVKSYAQSTRNGTVLSKLADVRLRGRKREMVG